MHLIWLFSAVFFLSGCAGVENTNNLNLISVKIGDSRDTLNRKMGTPKRNEQYSNDGKITEVWFYRTSRIGDGGLESDAEYTPVVIVDDKVIGWGRKFYDNSIRIKSDITIRNR